MEELTFTELKELYPTLSARSKVDLLVKIEALNEIDVIADEVEVEVVVDKKVYDAKSGSLTWYNIEQFIMTECKGRKKILVETPTTIEADFIWARINSEIFPKLNNQEISIMASSTRRDMHLNGTCYIRFVCHTNFDHLKRLMAYTDFKILT
jgi:hypothetical protein